MVCVQSAFDIDEGAFHGLPPQRQLKEGERRIPTGLQGIKANEVLNSVIGQMSDGMWENTPYYNKFWMFCNIDKDNSIIVQDRGQFRWDRFYCSGFREMDEQQVRDFFAKRIKAILHQFKKDYGIDDEEQKCEYMGYHEEISVRECREFAKALLNYKEGA